jgi:hypothetical protein
MTTAAAPDVPLRVPWWRHRRRLFWIAVILAAIGAPSGGWVWWYRSDFPMPPKEWLGRIGVVPGPVEHWCSKRYASLIRWKMRRETRLLRLEGSTWQNNATGAQLAFGRDGLIRVETTPGTPVLSPPVSSQFIAETEAVLLALDGTRYEFHPGLEPNVSAIEVVFEPSPRVAPSNLSFPDSPWWGFASCHYDQNLIILSLSPKEASAELNAVIGAFTRVPDR